MSAVSHPTGPPPARLSDHAAARPFPWLDRRGWVALALFLLVAGLLYWATLDTGLTPGDLEGGDLITHQYAQVQARPSNAPGYPLYTMGGWLWFHGWRLLFPNANPVPILSSYSTLWALLALAVFFIILYRLTRGNLVITLGIGALYAISYFFWYYAVSTEQYASAVLQTLLIVALIMAWDENPKDGWLYALAFLLGLGLAHMLTVLFIAPGALAFLLIKQPSLIKRWRLILISILLALLPLLSYLYVYGRGAQHPEWWGAGQWGSAWEWFISFIATQQGRDELPWALGPLTAEFPRLSWIAVPPLLLLLGLAGWWLWGRRYLVLFGSTAAIYFLFSYIDRFGNWYQVIMPLYPLILLGAAVSFQRLWEAFPKRLWRVMLTLVLLALIIPKAIDVYPRANQRNRPEDVGLTPGWAIIAQAPPANAAIIADVGEKLALDYLTGVWGQRPDIRVISPAEAAQALAEGRPLLVTANAAGYAAGESGLPLRYTAWGPTLLLAGDGELPHLPADDMTLVSADMGDGLKLVGYQTLSGDITPWWVRLALGAEQTPEHDWSLSVRLLSNGAEIAQQDHIAPALGFTPTTSLQPGDIVFDAFAFDLPENAPSPDALRIILYRQLDDGSFENLAVLDFPITEVSSDAPKS
jgi:hypothetical protein